MKFLQKKPCIIYINIEKYIKNCIKKCKSFALKHINFYIISDYYLYMQRFTFPVFSPKLISSELYSLIEL